MLLRKFPVGERGDRDGENPAFVRVERRLDASGIPTAVGVDDEHVSSIHRLMIEELRDVVLGTFEPLQLADPTRAEHVVPHEVRIGEWMKADEGPIAGERIEDGDD